MPTANPRLAVTALVCATVLVFGCAPEAGAPEAPPAIFASTPTAASAAVTPPEAPPVATPTVSATDASPALSPTAVPSGDSITISAVGDVSLAREVVDRMEANGADYPFALITPLVTGDIGFANLEGALTDRGDPWPKGYNFRTPPRFASGLLSARFNAVSLANNHTMDYGVIGLQDTIAALDQAGVRHAGAGMDITAAWAPAIFDVRGMTVAFLACVLTPVESGGFSIDMWAAGETTPGVAICGDRAITDAVTAARARSDFVVVAVHAGDEYINQPNATQRDLVAAAMAAGADAYIGAHAHVVQPIERRGAQLIAWGLGNFVFDLDPVDLANIPEPRVSLILNMALSKGSGVTSYDAAPVTQDAAEDRPRPATPAEANVLLSLIEP